MKSLHIKMEHCFGIKHLEHLINFGNTRTAIIYAPNGSMKSSFAASMEEHSKGNTPHDRLDRSKESKINITDDDNTFNPKNITIIKGGDIYDGSDKISSFLASKKLNEKYNAVNQQLSEALLRVITIIKTSSGSSNCEHEIISTFYPHDKVDIYTCFKSIHEYAKRDYSHIPHFKYGAVFDANGDIKKFLLKNDQLIKHYIDNYKKLIDNSLFFNNNDNGKAFGTTQANILEKSLSDNTYFDAGHTLKVCGDKEIKSLKEYKDLLDTELKNIVQDDNLQKTFREIDAALAKNAKLRSFKELLEKNNHLIPLLSNYEDFRKAYWYKHISLVENEFDALISLYDETIGKLKGILNAAKNETSRWEEIITIYNNRFSVPFTIHLSNEEDIIVKEKKAELKFEYANNKEFYEQTKDELLNILSTGEKRAFSILQFLFALESLKDKTDTQLIIFDDVADSFDYKNKFAIMEYMLELASLPQFRLLILTHNFDFYRTVVSRFRLHTDNIYMSHRSLDGSISLISGMYTGSIHKYFTEKEHFSQRKFLAYIPFIRNIIEYTKGSSNVDYMTLTRCLHIKKDTKNITVAALASIAVVHINDFDHLKYNGIYNSSETYFSYLKREAEDIYNLHEEDIQLENKIILALTIRLLAEDFLIKKIELKRKLKDINKNQTRELIRIYKHEYHREEDIIKILMRVNLMTPENLHVNSFMFEPLVDMSSNHLKKLYEDVKFLQSY